MSAGSAAALGSRLAPSPPSPLPSLAGNRTCAGASTSYAQPAPAGGRRCRQQASRRAAAAAAAARPRRVAAAASPSGFGQGEIAEVKDLRGIRVLKNEDGTPRVEYLVQWKDGSPDTWCAVGAGNGWRARGGALCSRGCMQQRGCAWN